METIYKENKLVPIGTKNAIYCGRDYSGNVATIIGNHGWLGSPIKLNTPCMICGQIHRDGGSTLNCYRTYLRNKINIDDTFKESIRLLNGKDLACFCRDKTKCHTSVLRRIIKELNTAPIHTL